ncbi:polyprenyl synthetase family protein [Albibacterium profundi]|uniref:Polyprenyl synthetase family protein n=1 Tax=Albibacterium profundi TaxID=3134906 RepID=A0ABV5CGM1_9SPHI
MQSIKAYQDIIHDGLTSFQFPEKPKDLYEPISYLLSIGGKRIRPTLTLLAAEMFGAHSTQALSSALAVEVFHNFSLMHDDIMDKAPLRRGQDTVHIKWNANTAILSGDFMLIHSYTLLAKNPPELIPPLLEVFNKTAAEVCIGQQLDMDFERTLQVEIKDYIEMIRLKTAVLIGASLQLGAITANAEPEQAMLLYEFGVNLGIAFQLQDDFLDAYGDPQHFGKQLGGDILENKKTYLLLKALELATDEDRDEIVSWLQKIEYDPDQKINTIMRIFNKLEVQNNIKDEIQQYTQLAYQALERVDIDTGKKAPLLKLSEELLNRTK